MFKSLKGKILFMMILLISASTVSSIVLSYFQIKNSVTNQMKNDGATLVTSLKRELERQNIKNTGDIQTFFRRVKDDSSGNLVYVSLSDYETNNIIVSDSGINTSSGTDKNSSGVDGVSGATQKLSADGNNDDNEIMSLMLKHSGVWVYNVSIPYSIDSGSKNTLNIGISLDDMNAEIRDSIIMVIAVAFIIQLIVLLVGSFIINSITRPVKDIISKLSKLSAGDFTVQFDCKNSDEIGKLSEALNKSISILKEPLAFMKNASLGILEASGFLTRSSVEASVSSNEIYENIEDVSGILLEQNNNIRQMEQYIGDLGQKLDNMASELDNMMNNSSKINEAANDGSITLVSFTEEFLAMKFAFEAATNEILNLNNNINQINEITEVINNIAKQTSLLSLNAAIESARVGEAGKGFAVVAEEIRKLADQVMVSSKNINSIIASVSSNAHSVVKSTADISDKMSNQAVSIEKTVNSFKNISSNISETASELTLVSESVMDISQGKDFIISSISQISEVSERVAAAAEEITSTIENQAASSEKLSNLAKELSSTAGSLQQNISVFKV